MRTTVTLALLALFALAACNGVPQDCKDDDRAAQDRCVIDAATSAKDPALCHTVEDQKYHDWCVTDAALAANDLTACEAAFNAGSADFCRRDILFARGEPTACAQLTTAKDSCYDKFARNRTDWRLCTQMGAGAPREACIDKLARDARDPYGCVALDKANDARDACLFSVSIRTSTVATCLEIADVEAKDYCLLNIAIKEQDASVCDETTPSFRRACRTVYAQETAKDQ